MYPTKANTIGSLLSNETKSILPHHHNAAIKAFNDDTHFGLALFSDPTAYLKKSDLTGDADAFKAVVDSVDDCEIDSPLCGDDFPELLTEGLYRLADGPGTLDGDHMTFRDGSNRVVLVWTDADSKLTVSLAETIDALNAKGILVVGLQSGSDSDVTDLLRNLATGTGATAGSGGLDCNSDGELQPSEPVEGEGIVCPNTGTDLAR